jgi:thiamine-phosphate pyrophosphorylase
MRRLVLPRLYVILDASLLKQSETECAAKLVAAGVRLLQYRNKEASSGELLEKSRAIAELVCPRGVMVFVNDRPDVAYLAGASGVHVGQHDLGVDAARRVIGKDKLVGISTHNLEQFSAAVATSADYIAVGPVFETRTKANPDPVVGAELVRRARAMTDTPIVAIGGITLERASDIIAAGADSVAVISDILLAQEPAERAAKYVALLEKAPPVNDQNDSDVWLS